MRLRVAGMIALATAALGWVVLAAPRRADVAAAEDRFGRLRVERDRQRARVAALERGAERRARLAAAVPDDPSGDPASALRWRVLRAVERAGVSNVRLDVSAGRAPRDADLRLEAAGDLAAVRRLVEALSAPDIGLALGSVEVRAGSAGRLTVAVRGTHLTGAR